MFAKFEYLEGGVETGFRHVEPEQYRSRLLHVKGKEKLAVFEVDRSVKSMNCGDVFILDCGLKLIQFNGKECSTQEKMVGNIEFCILKKKKFNKIFCKFFF